MTLAMRKHKQRGLWRKSNLLHVQKAIIVNAVCKFKHGHSRKKARKVMSFHRSACINGEIPDRHQFAQLILTHVKFDQMIANSVN